MAPLATLLLLLLVAPASAHDGCFLTGLWADNSERGFYISQAGWSLLVFEAQFGTLVPGGVSRDCTTLWVSFSGEGNVTGSIAPHKHRNITWSDHTPWVRRAPRNLTMDLTTYLDTGCSTPLANYSFTPNYCFTSPSGVSFMGQCSETGTAWSWMISAYPKPACDGSGGGVSWYGGNNGACGPMGYLGGASAVCSFAPGGMNEAEVEAQAVAAQAAAQAAAA